MITCTIYNFIHWQESFSHDINEFSIIIKLRLVKSNNTYGINVFKRVGP